MLPFHSGGQVARPSMLIVYESIRVYIIACKACVCNRTRVPNSIEIWYTIRNPARLRANGFLTLRHSSTIVAMAGVPCICYTDNKCFDGRARGLMALCPGGYFVPKEKTLFACTACGHEASKWLGRCPACGAWNTMEEVAQKPAVMEKPLKQRPGTGSQALPLDSIPDEAQNRALTGMSELDRVLGGGVVEGSVMLVGGDPGIGKSTLLLQVSAYLANAGERVLYITGEESARQLKLRASRLGITAPGLYILAENAMDAVEEKFLNIQPAYAVVDSIQTMYRPELGGAPGSVSQVRESASMYMRLAKTSGTAIFLVGHVTKEGAIAGPRILEHMVDVVLYFEGDRQQEYRLLRAVKNRFGSVNELGVFQMMEDGMREVANASELLLSHRAKGASGSVVFCGMEGSRPMLVDIQALATQTYYGMPRRTVNGMDQGRIALLLAVLEKRAGQKLFNQDVYINVAGGMELNEPAADLAVCAAVASSLANQAMPADYAVMGEVGLAGEVRAIPQAERRLTECMRLGFSNVVLPRENMKRVRIPDGMKAYGVDTLAQALAVLLHT